MNRLIEENRDDLVTLCQRFHVRSMELFGSAASERFDTFDSELDFLVTFEDLEPGEYAEGYFGLLEALQDLFRQPVDLVVTSAVKNPYFLEEIRKTRTLLYAA